MSIKTIIANLRWWASYCEKGGQECYAAQSLRDAADILERLQKRFTDEAAAEICRYCRAEKCVGRNKCPPIVEKVRRIMDGE